MTDSPNPAAMPDMMQLPCPTCGEPMKLTQVAPAAPGHDLRLFECKCGHTETRDVAYK
jgi:hypothetical protein